jgi:hypothetical protein
MFLTLPLLLNLLLCLALFNSYLKESKRDYCNVNYIASPVIKIVVEIQKGILLYSCHIVGKFLNIDTKHNKTQQSQNAEARRR